MMDPVKGSRRKVRAKDIFAESIALHEQYRGKISVHSKVPLANRHDLSLAYTPGVASVCREIAKNRDLAWTYTIKANTIAIVTDGSRVLSMGNIGGYAAIPVMEGKALLFKKLAGIDAFPICFESYETVIAKIYVRSVPGKTGTSALHLLTIFYLLWC